MKRMAAAWLLLAATLLCCGLGLWFSRRSCADMSRRLSDIVQAIEDENRPRAYALSEEAEQTWGRYHRVFCLFLSHERLEVIDREMAALPVALRWGEDAQAAMEEAFRQRRIRKRFRLFL